ncbi:hypothetical protein VTN77DRAFT_692 [Rasamsonia byssochlamydoides]|uniref:uncharacterized protein n=1 Tax=Rasamsonia byssochlamydoides TaxID=89139 RepID=UPI0037441BAF
MKGDRRSKHQGIYSVLSVNICCSLPIRLSHFSWDLGHVQLARAVREPTAEPLNTKKKNLRLRLCELLPCNVFVTPTLPARWQATTLPYLRRNTPLTSTKFSNLQSSGIPSHGTSYEYGVRSTTYRIRLLDQDSKLTEQGTRCLVQDTVLSQNESTPSHNSFDCRESQQLTCMLDGCSG